MPTDLLRLSDLTPRQVDDILDLAGQLKRHPYLHTDDLAGELVILYYTPPATRERITFADAAEALGATVAVVGPRELARADEPRPARLAQMADTYATMIVARTSDDDLLRLAQHTTIPVVNAHSPSHRPCQALADLLVLRDSLGGLDARRLAYIGDPTESRDLIETAAASAMDIRISPAAGIDPEPALTAARTIADRAGGRVASVIDPAAAAEDADAIYINATTTATIAPIGRAISCYDLAIELLATAATDAVVLHDPPTHPGQCIAPLLVRHPNAKLRSQAENRLPSAKALLLAATDHLAPRDQTLAHAAGQPADGPAGRCASQRCRDRRPQRPTPDDPTTYPRSPTGRSNAC